MYNFEWEFYYVKSKVGHLAFSDMSFNEIDTLFFKLNQNVTTEIIHTLSKSSEYSNSSHSLCNADKGSLSVTKKKWKK